MTRATRDYAAVAFWFAVLFFGVVPLNIFVSLNGGILSAAVVGLTLARGWVYVAGPAVCRLIRRWDSPGLTRIGRRMGG